MAAKWFFHQWSGTRTKGCFAAILPRLTTFSGMNYLAHLYLSQNTGELMIGNFIGDAVKGNALEDLSPGRKAGVVLHRKIDTYTDQHPVTQETNAILRPYFRKYAGVVSDVFYDHFLAINWSEYHDTPLDEYTAGIYRFLGQHAESFPFKSQQFFQYIQAGQVLESYATISGISRVMLGMSRRASFVSDMEKAGGVLEKHYEALEADFRKFFPDLVRYVQNEFPKNH